MGSHDPAHTGRLRRPADGAEVLWILQAVEHQQHGIGPLGEGFARHRFELPVLPRTDVGDHALVSLGVRDVVQLASVGRLDRDAPAGGQLSKLLQARFVPESFSQQEPFDRPPGAEGLEDRIAPVDDVRRPRHELSIAPASSGCLPWCRPTGSPFQAVAFGSRPSGRSLAGPSRPAARQSAFQPRHRLPPETRSHRG